jgi:uncharacterized protein (TIGR02246 family)
MLDDAAVVESLISRLIDAHNTNDVKLFASVFAEDADFNNVFGQPAKGRKAIEDFHAPLFSEPRQPGLPSFVNARLEVIGSTIRFLRSDVAAVDVQWRQTGAIGPDGQAWGTRYGLINCIAMREHNVWEIAVFHNMDLPETPIQRTQ